MKRVFLPVILLAVLCMGCTGVTVELSGQPQVVTPEVETPKCCPEPELTQEVLFFTQKGCPPCEKARPRVEEMRKQGLKVTEVWYHENPEMFKQYGVSSTPTFIILEDGVEIERTGDIVLLITILVKILAWLLPILLG
jgi:thiol-disulfide isomerase/thioredoxin